MGFLLWLLFVVFAIYSVACMTFTVVSFILIRKLLFNKCSKRDLIMMPIGIIFSPFIIAYIFLHAKMKDFINSVITERMHNGGIK